MDAENPLGKKMNLEKEMNNMSKIFNTHQIINIKEKTIDIKKRFSYVMVAIYMEK